MYQVVGGHSRSRVNTRRCSTGSASASLRHPPCTMSGKKRKESVSASAGIPATVEVPLATWANISALVEPLAKRLGVLEEAHRTSRVEINLLKSKVVTLERKNDKLERELRSHQLALEALGGDVSWEYSAPDINQNEMFLAGHTVDYIHDAKVVEHHFKYETGEMRRERFQQLEEVAIGNSNMTNVIDCAHLGPHWHEFYKGLKLSKGCDALCFTNVTIPDDEEEDVDFDLYQLMRSKDIFGLCLDNNGIDDDQIGPILLAVRDCPMLQTFHWQNNNINRQGDLDELVDTIIRHPKIDIICLENCLGEGLNGTRVMDLLLSNDRLREITLKGLGIRSLGDKILPYFEAWDHTLEELNLDNNNLNDDDAKLIARALRQNRSLLKLSLRHNDITAVGLAALADAVCDMRSFESLFASNHRCEVLDLHPLKSFQQNGPWYSTRQSENRALKFFALLAIRHADCMNATHLSEELGDASLGLVPDVIHRVQRLESTLAGSLRRAKPEGFGALSIIFELSRSWHMPELYEMPERQSGMMQSD